MADQMFQILSTCKGGGYRYCRTRPLHPRRNSKGLYPLHRVIAENNAGRLLQPDEDVHHIDGNKENNAPGNLEVLTKSEHAKRHNPDVFIAVPCGNCGVAIQDRRWRLMSKIKRNASGQVFCSQKCVRAARVMRRAAG